MGAGRRGARVASRNVIVVVIEKNGCANPACGVMKVGASSAEKNGERNVVGVLRGADPNPPRTGRVQLEQRERGQPRTAQPKVGRRARRGENKGCEKNQKWQQHWLFFFFFFGLFWERFSGFFFYKKKKKKKQSIQPRFWAETIVHFQIIFFTAFFDFGFFLFPIGSHPTNAPPPGVVHSFFAAVFL
jgi:hypothetical protein